MLDAEDTPDHVAPLIGVISSALGLSLGAAVDLRGKIEAIAEARDERIRSEAVGGALRQAMDTEVQEAGFTISLERLTKRFEANREYQTRFAAPISIDENLLTTTGTDNG